MSIGPLQIVLVKVPDAQRTQPIAHELSAARKKGIIRLVDLLYISKDMDGTLHSQEWSDLTQAQKVEYGEILQGLMGMRAAYKTAGDVDEVAKALSLSQADFGLSGSEVQEIADHVPNGGSAMLALFEHSWAVSLREAVLNAGGEVIAQGLLNPTALAIGGTTLEDALQAAHQIEEQAEQTAAQELADADQTLQDAKFQAQAKLDEAQRILDRAEAEAATRLAQARAVAAANIAASVSVASGRLEEADELVEQRKREADEEIALGAAIARAEVEAGQEVADDLIEAGEEEAAAEVAAGTETAERIKAAASIEALRLLYEAELIKEEYTREAVKLLVEAEMIREAAAEEAVEMVLAARSESS